MRTPLGDLPLGAFAPNSDLNARLNGLDPASPYVTQRPNTGYVWYKVGEGSVERRDAGLPLAQVDPTLSCARFADADWLRRERPEWPETLSARVARLGAEVAGRDAE